MATWADSVHMSLQADLAKYKSELNESKEEIGRLKYFVYQAREIAENLKHRIETPSPDNPCSQIVGKLPWRESRNSNHKQF